MAGTEPSVTWLQFYIVPGTKLFSTVYAVNGAGLESPHVTTDGITIDTTPPDIQSAPILVQINAEGTSLEASWNGSAVDNESPIVNFQLAIGTTTGNCFRVTYSKCVANEININNLA